MAPQFLLLVLTFDSRSGEVAGSEEIVAAYETLMECSRAAVDAGPQPVVKRRVKI